MSSNKTPIILISLVFLAVFLLPLAAAIGPLYGNFTYGNSTYGRDTVSPTLTFSLDKTDISIDDSIVASCSGADDSSISPTVSITTTPPGGSSAAVCSATGSCSGSVKPTLLGTTSFACAVTDSASNTVSQSLSATVSIKSSGSSGGGGGGGSSGTTVTTTPSSTYSTTITSINPGTPVKVAVSKPEIGVSEIALDVIDKATNVDLSVKKYDARPAAASSDAPGTVYRYLEITANNLASTNIRSAEIEFKVEKTWLTQNGADKDKVALNRFADSKWNKLETTSTGDDSSYVIYKAKTPGFSAFAVTFEKPVENVTTPPAVAPGTPTPAGQPPAAQPAQQPSTPPAGLPSTTLIIVVVVVIVIIGLALKFKLKK